jgi:hypothetical protein
MNLQDLLATADGELPLDSEERGGMMTGGEPSAPDGDPPPDKNIYWFVNGEEKTEITTDERDRLLAILDAQDPNGVATEIYIFDGIN